MSAQSLLKSMYNFIAESQLLLNSFSAVERESDNLTHMNMDSFLASVEKRAYIIALASCQDQQNALDIVQDSMLSMVRSYATKKPEEWPALFFRVLNNRITDQHRKRGFGRLKQWFGNTAEEREFATDAVDQLSGNEFGPDVQADSASFETVFDNALSTLSFKQQQALVLRLWQGLSVKETAVAMGISEGSVKTHLSRAVHEMRGHLQEFKPE